MTDKPAVKIKTDEFERVCRLAKLIERKASVSTFTTQDNMEGLELKAGKIIPFWIKDGAKMYDRPVSDTKIASVIGAFEEKPKEVKKDGKTPDKVDETSKLDKKTSNPEKVGFGDYSIINNLPAVLKGERIIAFQDIDDLKKMSVFDRMLLFQKAPKGFILKRKGFLLPTSTRKDKKDLTDADYKMYKYVPSNVQIMEANIAFLFEWSAVVEETHWFPDEVVCRGYIQVEINGKLYQKPCGGSGKKKNDNMDWGDVLETAIAEMQKRGFKKLGFNNDVYRDEVED